jgi:hypothetical protein
MSTIGKLWGSKGGKLYLIILTLCVLSAFFVGYFYAKNETPPIIIEKAENN